jgi:hypothetical protein
MLLKQVYECAERLRGAKCVKSMWTFAETSALTAIKECFAALVALLGRRGAMSQPSWLISDPIPSAKVPSVHVVALTLPKTS